MKRAILAGVIATIITYYINIKFDEMGVLTEKKKTDEK